MNTRSSPVLKGISRFSAGLAALLLVLFIGVHILQAVHTHTGQTGPVKTTKCSVQRAINRCQLCDYVLHKQISAIQATHVAVYVTGTPVALCLDQVSSIRARMMQLWTNKGPPAAGNLLA